MEFDHVIVLGDWKEQVAVERREEERRLYYVAMTRARKTLALYELDGIQNPYTSELGGSGLRRIEEGSWLHPTDEDLRRDYSLLDLSSIWIGYPALSRDVRRRIALLKCGDMVRLEKREGEVRIFVRDMDGQKVGALSNAAGSEWEARLPAIKSVRIHSIIVWRKEFLNQEPEPDCPDEWEVPLLEVVWKR